jgi:hypothetical protein
MPDVKVIILQYADKDVQYVFLAWQLIDQLMN